MITPDSLVKCILCKIEKESVFFSIVIQYNVVKLLR